MFNLRPVSTVKPPLVGFWMFSHQVNNCMPRSWGGGGSEVGGRKTIF